MEVISYSYIYLYSFTLFTINDNCCMKLVNTICFFILLGTLLSCNNEKELYIDSSSKASIETGDMDSPYKSIESALQGVRNMRSEGDDGNIKLVLRSGKYYFNTGFILDETMSNLSIVSYPDENVTFSGGVEIPTEIINNDKIGNTKVLSVDLNNIEISDFGRIKNVGFSRPSQNSFAELFINGEPMHLSRWPNEGMIRMVKIIDKGSIPRYDDFENRGAVMEYDSLRISGWKFRPDMWISGYFHWGYADDALMIKDIDSKKRRITTDGATLYGFNSSYAWNKWYAFNIKEETDAPGEYYLDKEENKLYFISPVDKIESLSLSVLEQPFFDIWKASNITIEGINFECSRSVMISLCETENVRIKDCKFTNGGNLGIMVGMGIKPFEKYLHAGIGTPVRGIIGSLQQHIYEDTDLNRKGGHNNIIEGCEFYNLGAGAVSLGGGNRTTLEPGNNIVKNCLFHDNNRIEKSYRPAVHITGVGNKILNSEMYNSPSMAILMHGNNHEIAYNYIHDVCLEVEDQGAFYYGRNPSECGTVLRYNLFANIPDIYNTCSVYHDDGAGGLTVENNLFYKPGKFTSLIGGGSDNVYNGNVFIDGQIGIHADDRLRNWGKALIEKDGLFEKRLNEVNYLKEPYITQYPYLKDYIPNDSMPKRNIVDSNYFISIKKITDNEKALDMQNNKVMEIRNIPDKMNTISEIITFISAQQDIKMNPEWNNIGIR